MKKFLLILLVMSVGFQGSLLAQTKTVTGTVTGGDDGLAIPGVNVTVKGTSRGIPTGLDGKFSLQASSDETLVFSFVGYITQEVLVGSQTTINVTLQPDFAELDEVVVIGYGTQEKKEITSSVASLSPEDFNTGNVPNPTQLLQGKVAGLSITRPGGDPNGGFNIRLRGVSTFGANSEPLIVLDGVPGADLNNVDPNDIASIDVLKDGSAAAIYGARGSSGVILITTTKGSGKEGVTSISMNNFVSVDRIMDRVDVLSAQEFLDRGGNDLGSETNWMDEVTQTGVSFANNVSLAGSFGNTSYRGSVNYRNNQGIIKGVGNERINTRLNLSHNAINDRLRLNMNLSMTNRDYTSRNNALFRYAKIYNPTAPVYSSENEQQFGPFFQRNLFDFFNPEALRRQQLFGGSAKTLFTSYRAEFDVLDNLTASLQYTQDRLQDINGGYWSRQDIQRGFGGGGIANRSTNENLKEIITGTLNYTTDLTDDLKLTALLGFERQNRSFQGFGAEVRQFLFDSQTWNNLGAGAIRLGANTNLYSYKNEDILSSSFARANFTFKGAYFLSASVRAESFSGFGENEKTGYFPAFSAGAELADVADMGIFNSLKVRVSYGITGNLPPSATLALPVLGNGNRVDLDGDPLTTNDIFVGLNQFQNPNPTLKWETKKEFDIGFDFAIFDSKITGAVDYYRRNVEDLIFNVGVPIGAANPFDPGNFNTAGSTWVNLADLESGGFEFIASVNNISIGSVSWTPTLNFTIYDKVQISSLTAGDGLGFDFIRPESTTPGSPGQNNNPIIENRVGSTLGNFWGPRFLGVDENNEWVLSAGLDEIDQFEIVGNALPDADFGFQNVFTMGNWNLNFLLRGSIGHDLYNSYRGFYENSDPASNTWNSVVTDKTPGVVSTPTFSSLFVEDASFIRLDNLQLGYNIPTNAEWLTNLNVYVAAQNLFVITNYEGVDPEVRYTDLQNGDGFTTALSPGIERRDIFFPTTTLTFGVNVNIK